ncbi:MAG: peptidylprolyl isomerase [Planctomycetota bacterium]|nr:peptidylprolyl isomerase [Planctomycetota bacterium]
MTSSRSRRLAAAVLALLMLFGTALAQELAYAIFIRVNGKPITQENVAQAMRFLLQREYKGQMPFDEQERENLQRAAIRDLVRTYLIHDEAAKLGLKPNRAYTQRAIAAAGFKQEAVTPTIRKMLEADDLFDDIMLNSGTPIKNPSPREIKDFYTRNRDSFRNDAYIVVRTIFIADDGSREHSYFKSRAEDLWRTLSGTPLSTRTEAFSKAAQESSQDIFAQFGGLLTGAAPEPWMPQDFSNDGPDGKPIFPEEMVAAIRRMKSKGEIRMAVSSEGFHLLYLEGIRGGNIIGWEEASRIIDFYLKQQYRNERLRTWIGRVYDRGDVRWHDGSPYEKSRLTEMLLPSEHGGANTPR